MSNPNDGGGAPNTNAGGAGGQSGDSAGTPNSNTNQNPRTVSWEDHKRAIDDMMAFKKKVTELETRLGSAESERLREKGDYQALYEKEKQRADAAEQKQKEVLGWAMETQRFNAVRTEAVAAGLKKEALGDLELLDLGNDVTVETTSRGRFIVNGAKERVEKLKTERSHWFNTEPPPIINTGGGSPPAGGAGAGGKKVTLQDVVQSEKDLRTKKIDRVEYMRIQEQYRKDNPLRVGVIPPQVDPSRSGASDQK